MKEVIRTSYLQQMQQWRDQRIIKVITGIRRAGKSTLLRQFQHRLIESGVAKERIVSILFEDMDNERLLDAHTLHSYLTERIADGSQTYIFLDEVQLVPGFERVVNSLYLRDNVDIYITGSNSQMLSGELATLLSGRYVTIHILPLSFAEFASARPGYSQEVYNLYTETTSFPYALTIDDSDRLQVYMQDIYNTVMMRDVVLHNKIDNISVLMRLSRFLADNIGNLTTGKLIADTLTSAGMKTNSHTIDTYLQYLCNAYLYYPVKRYDIRGNELLRIGQKYYLADIGLRHTLISRRNADRGRVLENIVYLELLRRGYQVFVGMAGGGEVDFVSIRNRDIEYYQVSESVIHPDTLTRELTPLNAIRNHYPKYLLTLDNQPPVDYDGIHRLYAIDWLLKEK